VICTPPTTTDPTPPLGADGTQRRPTRDGAQPPGWTPGCLHAPVAHAVPPAQAVSNPPRPETIPVAGHQRPTTPSMRRTRGPGHRRAPGFVPSSVWDANLAASGAAVRETFEIAAPVTPSTNGFGRPASMQSDGPAGNVPPRPVAGSGRPEDSRCHHGHAPPGRFGYRAAKYWFAPPL